MTGLQTWRRRGAVALLVALIAVLAAAPFSSSARAGGEKPSPPAAIHSDFSFAISFEAEGESETITLNGSLDLNLTFPNFSMRMRMELPDDETFGFEGSSFELIVVDGVAYTREDGGSWDSEELSSDQDLAEMLGTLSSTPGDQQPFDVQQSLAMLEQLGLRPRQLADETINGLPVHHLRVELGAEQLFGILSTVLAGAGTDAEEIPDADDLAELQEEVDLRAALDLWTGVRDGFPYRFTARLDITGIGESEGMTASFEFTMNNLPLPQPVPIVAPI
jgi:hypothetical protein